MRGGRSADLVEVLECRREVDSLGLELLDDLVGDGFESGALHRLLEVFAAFGGSLSGDVGRGVGV